MQSTLKHRLQTLARSLPPGEALRHIARATTTLRGRHDNSAVEALEELATRIYPKEHLETLKRINAFGGDWPEDLVNEEPTAAESFRARERLEKVARQLDEDDPLFILGTVLQSLEGKALIATLHGIEEFFNAHYSGEEDDDRDEDDFSDDESEDEIDQCADRDDEHDEDDEDDEDEDEDDEDGDDEDGDDEDEDDEDEDDEDEDNEDEEYGDGEDEFYG